jgi:Holliday junction resolvasome RuvABC endonuclease subunit
MRIIGFDPASTIGWSVIEDNKIVDFGKIQCSNKFTLPQKLNYYHLEVERLVDRYDPDYMAVEDLILGISGVKVLALLARINGVVIQAGFHKLKDRARMYEPSEWKANSIPNIKGSSPKWKIQLETCRYFDIDLNGEYDRYDIWEKTKKKEIENLRESTHKLKSEIDKLKASTKRKRNPLTETELAETKNKITQMTATHTAMKKQLSELKKAVDKELSEIGIDIDAQTGISSDIADSMCIAICLQKQL